MECSKNPIGLFDSGIGGTSIWREVNKLLPNENTLYLADSSNAPYGQKSREEIIRLSKKNTEFLLEQNCKLIVVACNTATTNAIKELRESYDVPFIGIEPAIKPAALHTKTGTVGILAIKGTLNSELFHKTVSSLSHIRIIEQVGFGLVQLIEEGKLGSAELEALPAQYLRPMVEANMDCLVLGCSHYPYLIPQIRKLIPGHIEIIDSGQAVARQTKSVLEKNALLTENNELGENIFYTNSEPAVLQMILGNAQMVRKIDF